MIRVIEGLREEGYQVDPVSFPYLDTLVPAYYVMAMQRLHPTWRGMMVSVTAIGQMKLPMQKAFISDQGVKDLGLKSREGS